MLSTLLLTAGFVAVVVVLDTVFAWALCRFAARGNAIMYAAMGQSAEGKGQRAEETGSPLAPHTSPLPPASPLGADLADQHALLCRAEDRFARTSFAIGLISGTVLTTLAFVFFS